MEIRGTRTPYFAGDGIDFRILDQETKSYVEKVSLKQVANDRCEIPVAFHLNMHSAQQLMDSLWDCGLRPTDGSGSAGAMLATQRHLEDMKRIAFHALKVK